MILVRVFAPGPKIAWLHATPKARPMSEKRMKALIAAGAVYVEVNVRDLENWLGIEVEEAELWPIH